MSESNDPNATMPEGSGDHDHDHAHDHDHHGHDHDHHHDALHPHVGEVVEDSELDPGGRALSGALRLAFRVLSYVMWFVVALYIISGSKKVDDGHVGVKVLLGEINEEVLEPGGPHFWFPKPAGEILLVPTTVRALKMDEEFMPFVPPGRDWNNYIGVALKPGIDGCLLTGDRNIVHAKWTVDYHIPQGTVLEFVRNVGMADAIKDRDSIPPDVAIQDRPHYFADRLVRLVAERAIVKTVASVNADRFLGSGLTDQERLSLMQSINVALSAKGAGFESGIRVTNVSLTGTQKPKLTESAFEEVTNAETDRAKMITDAEKAATEKLSNAAGTAHKAMVLAIDFYDQARESKDPKRINKGERLLLSLLKGASASQALWVLDDEPSVDKKVLALAKTDDRVAGQASEVVQRAISQRKQTVDAIKAQAKRYEELLPAYRANPNIERSRLFLDAWREILSSDQIETNYIPGSAKQIWIEFAPSDRYRKDRDSKKLRDAREKKVKESGRVPGY